MVTQQEETGWLDRISDLSITAIFFHPVALMVCLMSAVVVLAIGLWNKYHQTISDQSHVKLSSELISLSPKPDWIKVDIKSVAISDSGLSDINLYDNDAVKHVANAMAVQPWVKSVQRVSKSANGIRVDVKYRKPVAIVEVQPHGFFPIDAEAVVLDGSGYTQKDTSKYWRISVRQSLNQALSFGRAWNDLRIKDAANIAAYLCEYRQVTHLMRIVNYSVPTRDRLRMEPFQLWTARGTKIVWGSAPGVEKPGEANAKLKIAAIIEFIENHGDLDEQTSQTFDVRSGLLEPIASEVALENSDFLRLN